MLMMIFVWVVMVEEIWFMLLVCSLFILKMICLEFFLGVVLKSECECGCLWKLWIMIMFFDWVLMMNVRMMLYRLVWFFFLIGLMFWFLFCKVVLWMWIWVLIFLIVKWFLFFFFLVLMSLFGFEWVVFLS